MSKASASCKTMCWPIEASERMRASINSAATVTGISCSMPVSLAKCDRLPLNGGQP